MAVSDPDLAALRTPTLVLLGGRSVYHDAHAAAARARRLLPAGEVELWPAASRAVAAECPDEVNDRILGFVRQVDSQ